MDLSALLTVGQMALELGLICSLTVLALFLSYSMLNVCDLSTDGCFTLGAAGACSGLVTALLQTNPGYPEIRHNQSYPEEKNIPKFQREPLKNKGLSAKTSG